MKNLKSYRDYIEKTEEKIHEITPEWEAKLGKGKILIPRATDVEELIRKTEAGNLLTNDTIREHLAAQKGVQVTAAIPTGINLKFIALTSEFEQSEGKRHTAYWRVLKPDGKINEKFPGGFEKQIRYLEAEGHDIEMVGKRKKVPRVRNFESKLLILNL